MIERECYEKLKKHFGDVASWALWREPVPDAKGSDTAAIADMSVFEREDLLDVLNPKCVFIGLNASREVDRDIPWTAFHSGNPRQKDYKLRYALFDSRFWGAYLTDLFKEYVEPDSGNLVKYVRQNPQVLAKNLELLREELACFSQKPVLVAIGNAAYGYLRKSELAAEYRITKIMHYAYFIGKEEYRNQVQKELPDF